MKDRTNVEALRIYTFYLLTRENDMEYVSEKLGHIALFFHDTLLYQA